MVDKTIELVSWRRINLADLCAWAVGSEVVQQGPGADGAFGRSPVTVEEACAIEPARHGIHVTIQHIAGAMSKWMIVSQDKALGFCAQLENGFQDVACGILLCP